MMMKHQDAAEPTNAKSSLRSGRTHPTIKIFNRPTLLHPTNTTANY